MPPYSVILDTDICDDFDDMCALTYMLSAPHLYHPELIIVSTFNTPLRALVVAYTLSLLNKTHIPILIGASTSNRSCYQASWVPSTFTLDSYTKSGGIVQPEGVLSLIGFIAAWPASSPPLHYVEIAPASSLGTVLKGYPEAAKKLSVFAMNGELRVGYGNVTQAQVEYNVAVDIPASQAMYAHAADYQPPGLVVAPLDSTIFQQYNGELWKAFIAFNDSKHPAVSALLGAYQHWYDAGGKNNGALLPYSPETGTSTMFDVQAMYSAGHYMTRNGSCRVDVPELVGECVQGLAVNATGYLVEGVKGAGNVSVQVGVMGGRQAPYKAIDVIGGIVLSAIAGVVLLKDEAPVVSGQHVRVWRVRDT